MNVFQLNYDTRLQAWYNLRKQIENSTLETKCIETDKFWQSVPLVSNHLHLYDQSTWPNPWELLVENTYCTVARSLGMCYTLLLVGVNSLEIAEATDNIGDDTVLVLVDNAKYILNYHPNTVISNSLLDFTIRRTIDIDNIRQKLL